MNRWVTWLFVAVCVALILAALFRIFTPQDPPIPQTQSSRQNFNGTLSSFSGIEFTGEGISTPSQLNIISVSPNLGAETMVQNLSQAFSLVPNPELAGHYIGPEYYLSESSDRKWALAQNTASISENLVNTTIVQAAADAFINNYFPNQNLEALDERIEYLHQDDYHFDTVGVEEATAMVIPYAQVINGIPLFHTADNIAPITLWIDGSGTVFKATFSPPFYSLEERAASLEVVSLEMALNQINNSNASIVSSTQQVFGPIDLSQIIRGNMTSLSLEYRIDPELQIAYPFYRFSGTALNANNTQLDVQIITPAVATTTR